MIIITVSILWLFMSRFMVQFITDGNSVDTNALYRTNICPQSQTCDELAKNKKIPKNSTHNGKRHMAFQNPPSGYAF